MDVLREIDDNLQRGEDQKVAELTRQAIDDGLSASEILNDGLLAGMAVIGRRFGAHEIFLPEVLLAANSMKAGMTILRPLLDVPRERLEAMLQENRHPWIDDPSNDCDRFERIKIRKAGPVLDAIGLTPRRLSETARSMQRAHAALDHYADLAFSRSVHAFAFGFVSVDWPQLTGEPDEVIFRILARLINAVAGSDYPPRFAALERLRDRIEGHGDECGNVATLAGCTFEREGHLIWIYREAGRRGFPDIRVRGGESLIWDKRFAVESSYGRETCGTVKALGAVKDFKWGASAAPVREGLLCEGLPKRAVETVPAFLVDNEIVHIAGEFTAFESKHCGQVIIRPIHHDMRMMSQGFR